MMFINTFIVPKSILYLGVHLKQINCWGVNSLLCFFENVTLNDLGKSCPYVYAKMFWKGTWGKY